MPLPDFSPGEVLTASAMDSIGLWLVKTDTITSGNSKEITNAFSSSYKNYKIVLSNIRISASANVYFRMGTLATGNLYRFSGIFAVYGSTTLTVSGSNGTNQWEIGCVATNAGESSAVIELQMPQQAMNTTFQALGNDPRSGGGGNRMVTGYLANTTQYTSFSLFNENAATFTSCDIAVYGYRN